jgi:hypothetical protein
MNGLRREVVCDVLQGFSKGKQLRLAAFMAEHDTGREHGGN